MERREKRGLGSALVRLNDVHVDEYCLASLRQINGIRIRALSRWMNAVSLSLPIAALDAMCELNCVSSLSLVASAQRQPLLEADTLDFSSHFIKRNALQKSYGESAVVLNMLNVDAVHRMGHTGKGVRVLMLDSGFSVTHPCLRHIKVIDTYDFVHNDTNVADEGPGEDGDGRHGTACLSTVAGRETNLHSGVAPDVEVLLGKTEAMDYEERIEEDFFVAGLEWGEAKGAHLVSSSLGYHEWWKFNDYNGRTSVASRAVDEAVARGMVVIMAAGNYATTSLTTPADAAGAIAVGSVGLTGKVSPFSSRGPTSDGRIKPDVSAPGEHIHVAEIGSGYTTLSGTSFATPLTAGVVALLLQANPSWKPRDVHMALHKTAKSSGEPNLNVGWGIVDAAAASAFKPQPCQEQGSCVHGTCKDGACVCQVGYYGPQCSYKRLLCVDWCKEQGRCFEGRCLCLRSLGEQQDHRCEEGTIPDWECELARYDDGETCDWDCGKTTAAKDPDCGHYTRALCEKDTPPSVPTDALDDYCTLPPTPKPVIQPPASPNVQLKNDEHLATTLPLVVTLLMVLLLIAGGVYLWHRRRRRPTLVI